MDISQKLLYYCQSGLWFCTLHILNTNLIGLHEVVRPRICFCHAIGVYKGIQRIEKLERDTFCVFSSKLYEILHQQITNSNKKNPHSKFQMFVAITFLINCQVQEKNIPEFSQLQKVDILITWQNINARIVWKNNFLPFEKNLYVVQTGYTYILT